MTCFAANGSWNSAGFAWCNVAVMLFEKQVDSLVHCLLLFDT